MRAAHATVERADREPVLAPPGTGDAAVARARVPVVPGGRHDEHVEVRRALRRRAPAGRRGTTAYGSASATSATRAASCASPSPVRVDRVLEPSTPGRSSRRPTSRRRRRAASRRPGSAGCSRLARRRRGRPGRRRRRGARPSRCRAARARRGRPGSPPAAACGSPPTTSIPSGTCPRRYGWRGSTPVSRRAISTPRPSMPGRPMSARWPARGERAALEPLDETAAG